MKSIFIYKINANSIFCSLLIMILLCFIVGGCSKSIAEGGPHVEQLLKFKVAGVTSATDVSNIKSASANPRFNSSDSYLDKKTVSVGNLDFDIASRESHISTTLEKFSSSSSGTVNRAATVPMGAGIKYRILVYTLGGNLVASREATADEELHITVSSGQKYKWVAYSYNTTDAISAPDPNNPTITTPTTTTLLYASDNETVQIDTLGTPISILFKHQLTQLNVQIGINEHEPERTITELNAEFSNDVLKTGTFNILTGAIVGPLTSVNGVSLNFTELTPGSGKTYIAKNYYTADASQTSYSVKITNLKVQYTSTEVKDLGAELPGVGVDKGVVTFVNYSGNNKGSVLLGSLKLWFVLPTMKIMAYSNNAGLGYQMEGNYASRNFMMSSYNFGPTSNYVRIRSIEISNHYENIAADHLKFQLANPANYPDILFIANWFAFLDAADWEAVIKYLKAGGRVYYGHDEPGSAGAAEAGLSAILGQTVTLVRSPDEGSGVYKFTDTPDAIADTEILNGPFGNVSPYFWGQDLVGTTYVRGYTGSDLIKYSITSQDYPVRQAGDIAMFRHKRYDFFYVGDGGFISNNNSDGSGSSYTLIPFRLKGGAATDPDRYFPVLAFYGAFSRSGSLMDYNPYNQRNGEFQIANSIFFGNLMSWMLHRAAFDPVKRDGSLRFP